jgi:hypothetical protein
VTDARLLNWTFVVPASDRFLLLPIDDERPDGAVAVTARTPEALDRALDAGPYAVVAAPDLASWGDASPAEQRPLLERLADVVAPGGWLYAGFPNAWYPGNIRRPGARSSRSVTRDLRAVGFGRVDAYVALPHHRCPAFLIEESDPSALRYFLDRLSFPYVESEDPRRARMKQLVLAAGRRAALIAPASTRARFAPGAAVVARRSP